MKKIFRMSALLIMMTMCLTASTQSINEYRAAHSRLLAKQTNVKDKIKVDESIDYAKTLYGIKIDDPDIYTEGWESERVNAYENANIPQTKTISITNYCMPVKHRVITSNFGYRKRFGRMHRGVDLKASVGDTVRSAFSGKVRITKFDRNGYGFYVVIRHDNGLETVYGHLSKFLIKQNQRVKAGEPIALSGNTGRSTGPHLHFETRYMGIAINPAKIFDFVNGVAHGTTFAFNKNEALRENNNVPQQQNASNGSNRNRRRK